MKYGIHIVIVLLIMVQIVFSAGFVKSDSSKLCGFHVLWRLYKVFRKKP